MNFPKDQTRKEDIKAVACCSLFAIGVLAIFILSGCGAFSLTSKTTGQTTNGVGAVVTVTNTVVNTNALISDAGIVKSIIGGALKLIPISTGERTILSDINLSIAGVINGASTNSPAQIASLISSKASTDATLSQALAPAVSLLSGLDQAALAKYGSANWEIIGIAFAKAISAAITQALQ